MDALELQSSVYTQNQERQANTKRYLTFAAERTRTQPGKRRAPGYVTAQCPSSARHGSPSLPSRDLRRRLKARGRVMVPCVVLVISTNASRAGLMLSRTHLLPAAELSCLLRPNLHVYRTWRSSAKVHFARRF